VLWKWGVALVAVPLFVACGGDEPTAAPTPCPRRTPVDPPGGIPKVLDQTSRGDVVEAGRRRGFEAVTVITDETVVELYPQLARGLLDGGHRIDAGDNEGFEAEIFFTLRDGRPGRYVLREGPCKGDVTLHILYEDDRS
jgi:hypothetical protein